MIKVCKYYAIDHSVVEEKTFSSVDEAESFINNEFNFYSQMGDCDYIWERVLTGSHKVAQLEALIASLQADLELAKAEAAAEAR